MADTEPKETKIASTPEKKVVEEEKKVVEEVDEDSKTSENGDVKEAKENGSVEEKDVEEKEAESTENGDSTETPAVDAGCIKRKSAAGLEVAADTSADGASPEKKAKLEEKPVEAESNGDAEAKA
ncbi:zinc finger E-box-binding homeobox 1 [Orussus abietinus]|uniref:zinc finger E-box-binding homeobox 1 n=1 Tax=Orussus abietinus TaxID=222816 RepID=UPI000626EA2C|nr:zinc finger E-box-binding homeobox 1 [Orussus abietinus]